MTKILEEIARFIAFQKSSEALLEIMNEDEEFRKEDAEWAEVGVDDGID